MIDWLLVGRGKIKIPRLYFGVYFSFPFLLLLLLLGKKKY
jgi:hypothetical protein